MTASLSSLNTDRLEAIAREVRSKCLRMTTRAGSGHPTSSLSAADLMTALFFGGVFRFDPRVPAHPNNDRLIFSKGHASPLLYALWHAAGAVSDEELTHYRELGSALEGHPVPTFPFAEAATGSLGQGLPIGLGMAINGRHLAHVPYRVYVLLGDSEMSEGSQWEAMQLAAHYQLGNLVGILDVNGLGQSGPTMVGFDVETYATRIESFGWETISIDGHDMDQILRAYAQAAENEECPTMIIARTVKGKGVSFLEGKEGWHGKALDDEELKQALDDLGKIDESIRGKIELPEDVRPASEEASEAEPPSYKPGSKVATRKAYGDALKRIGGAFPGIVALDAEVSNSTNSETFGEAFPNRFFEMYIAEQNMVGVALGLALRGRVPFVSTFAAFLTRAFDQIRMSQYSEGNIKFVGSHAGVSIGQDGPSQMGLEDIAMFRSIAGSIVLHPSDAMSTDRLVVQMARHRGLAYLRTMRQRTPVIYGPDEEFPIGGCKVLRKSDEDAATIVAAGVCVHEALEAAEILARKEVKARVIDLYSIKPIDTHTLLTAARETGCIVTAEDHYPEGGLGEAVMAALAIEGASVIQLAVRSRPHSGEGADLRQRAGIDAASIADAVSRGIAHQQSRTATREELYGKLEY